MFYIGLTDRLIMIEEVKTADLHATDNRLLSAFVSEASDVFSLLAEGGVIANIIWLRKGKFWDASCLILNKQDKKLSPENVSEIIEHIKTHRSLQTFTIDIFISSDESNFSHEDFISVSKSEGVAHFSYSRKMSQ